MPMTKRVAHTPGPWSAEAISESDRRSIGEDADSDRFWISGGQLDEVIATVHAPIHGDGEEANARLIAAAPDLLQALHEVVGAHAEAANCFYCEADTGQPHDDDCTMLFVLEAIAKAEGRS